MSNIYGKFAQIRRTLNFSPTILNKLTNISNLIKRLILIRNRTPETMKGVDFWGDLNTNIVRISIGAKTKIGNVNLKERSSP